MKRKCRSLGGVHRCKYMATNAPEFPALESAQEHIPMCKIHDLKIDMICDDCEEFICSQCQTENEVSNPIMISLYEYTVGKQRQWTCQSISVLQLNLESYCTLSFENS